MLLCANALQFHLPKRMIKECKSHCCKTDSLVISDFVLHKWGCLFIKQVGISKDALYIIIQGASRNFSTFD